MVLSSVLRVLFRTLFLLGALGFSQGAMLGASGFPNDLLRTELVAMGFSPADLCGEGPDGSGHEHCQDCLSLLAPLPAAVPMAAARPRADNFPLPPQRPPRLRTAWYVPQIRAPPAL